MTSDNLAMFDDTEEDAAAAYAAAEGESMGRAKRLVDYVLAYIRPWRDARNMSFTVAWDQYQRIFMGVWDAADVARLSERAQTILPMSQEAVETWAADIADATFGHGDFFEIEQDESDPNPKDAAILTKALGKKFIKTQLRLALDEICLTAGMLGTGIGEIVAAEGVELVPGNRPHPTQPGKQEIGVYSKDSKDFLVRPIHPKNFLIAQHVRSVEESVGVAIEETMPSHLVAIQIANGVFAKVPLGGATMRMEDRPDPTDMSPLQDMTLVTRWYGLVPKALLDDKAYDAQTADTFGDEDWRYKDLVEAMVFIADEGHVLKACESPYMCQDRPIVICRSDIMPGRFWGRGIIEKGLNMQSAADTAVRAHLDYLAMTSAPMFAMDSSRVPKGFKFNITPGRNVMINGNPVEAIQRLDMGAVTPQLIQTAELFQTFLRQSTGTIDVTAMPGSVSGDAKSGAMAMALSGIIKKSKRSLALIQFGFLEPLIKKLAVRYQQFCPEDFPVRSYDYTVKGSLGMMVREYESQQYTTIMATLGPQSAITPRLLSSIVTSSGLADKAELAADLLQASKDMAQKAQGDQADQDTKQILLRKTAAEAAAAGAQADLYKAQATKVQAEAAVVPVETRAKVMTALAINSDPKVPDNTEFKERMDVTNQLLAEDQLKEKVKQRQSNETIVAAELRQKHSEHLNNLGHQDREAQRHHARELDKAAKAHALAMKQLDMQQAQPLVAPKE